MRVVPIAIVRRDRRRRSLGRRGAEEPPTARERLGAVAIAHQAVIPHAVDSAVGLNVSGIGFDIGLASDFYAAIQAPGAVSSSLFSMSGTERTALGTIAGGEPVASLAVSLGVPFDPPAERVYAVTAAGELISFDANRASAPLSRVALTGLSAGERIVVQEPPNAGTLNTFQALGADAGVLGFDISLTQILIAMAPNAAAPTLLFDVANGARRNLGAVGNGDTVRALAISLGR